MIDRLTRDKWLAQFTIWAASEGLDVSACIDGEKFYYFSAEVEKLLLAYIAGRLDQLASSSIVTVPVVTATNWHEVNNTARG